MLLFPPTNPPGHVGHQHHGFGRPSSRLGCTATCSIFYHIKSLYRRAASGTVPALQSQVCVCCHPIYSGHVLPPPSFRPSYQSFLHVVPIFVALVAAHRAAKGVLCRALDPPCHVGTHTRNTQHTFCREMCILYARTTAGEIQPEGKQQTAVPPRFPEMRHNPSAKSNQGSRHQGSMCTTTACALCVYLAVAYLAFCPIAKAGYL